MLAVKGVPNVFENDYGGYQVPHSEIAFEAYKKWERGEGSGDAKVDWEMARRDYGLLPYPTEEEIRKEACLVYLERTQCSLPGTAEEDWFEAQCSLRQRFFQEWRSRPIRER